MGLMRQLFRPRVKRGVEWVDEINWLAVAGDLRMI
jgi:hypothetical protein